MSSLVFGQRERIFSSLVDPVTSAAAMSSFGWPVTRAFALAPWGLALLVLSIILAPAALLVAALSPLWARSSAEEGISL